MKKITIFFLAFLPLFVITLFFISGMVIKNYTHVFVTTVQIIENQCKVQKTDDGVDPTQQLHVNVLPHNATNPEVYYKSSDESILKVSNDGLVTCLGYGEASIYAISKENESISAKCDFEVWDDKVHDISADEKMARYIGFNQSFNLNAKPIPASHLQAVPIFHYESSDKSIVKVSPQGDVIAQNKVGDATITITTENEFWSVSQQVNVHVGVGVKVLDLDDPSNVTIQSRNYNLYDDIMVYPEEKNKVPVDDFEFTSSDTSAATIDANGEISFMKPEIQVTFTAKYIRNDLTITKRIKSTCGAFQDVFFNRYSFIGNIDDYKTDPYLKPKDVNFHTYPETSLFAGLDINSSNPNVIVVDNGKFKVVGSGSTTLTVTAKSAIEECADKTDSCFVTIYDRNSAFVAEAQVQTPSDSFRYYLRNNIIKENLSKPNEKISWEIESGSDIASIDNNDIIHFTKAGTARIKATSSIKTKSETFIVSCNCIKTTAIDVSTSSHFTIEADKRYVFKNKNQIWYPDESFLPNFTRVEDELGQTCYIPKEGRNYTTFRVYDGNVIFPEYKDLHLIVAEKPVDIKYAKDSLYFATSESIIPVDSLIEPLPSTSTTTAGQPVKIKTSFYPQDASKVSIDNNKISFSAPSSVWVKATLDNHEFINFNVESTCDMPGKFSLVNSDGTEIASGNEQIIAPGQSLTLYTSQIYSDFTLDEPSMNLFDIQSESGNNFITFERAWDPTLSRIGFTFKVNPAAYGSDVVTISSGSFKYYLNIQFAEQITGFDLYYKNLKLSEIDENSTYINRLILDVVVKPIKAKNKSFNASIIQGGEVTELEVTEDSKINLTDKLKLGDNIVVLTAADGSGFSKQYHINFKDPATITDFDVEQAVDEGGAEKVYIDCGSVAKTLTINVNGIVDDKFYDDNFSINFQAIGGETVQQSGKFVNIDGIAAPTDKVPGYENNITISLNSQKNIAHTYQLSREIVSRIEFPGHDNRDPEDAKGLQKVRAFGNVSIYSEEEGMVPYYKLPLNLYDYKGELIEDTPHSDAKLQAFNTLLPETNGRVGWAYHHFDQYNEKSFLQIAFTPDTLLSYQELYDNIFATPENRNAIFSLSTHNKTASATYTFVAVEALNVFCSYAFETDVVSNFKVLHSNVGLEGEVKDNIPMVHPDKCSWYNCIVGNGYAVNFNSFAALGPGHETIYVDIIMNLSVTGCYDDQKQTNFTLMMTDTSVETQKKSGIYYAYSTFKNFKKAFRPAKPLVDVYIKNCLFYQNKYFAIELDNNIDTRAETYVQDCIMFDCSCSAISNINSLLYIKGFLDIYNFKGQDMLADIEKIDLRFLFPVIVDAAREAGTLHIAADGTSVINTCYISEQTNTVFFWNDKTGQYESIHDSWPEEKYYWKPFFTIDVSLLGYKPSIWGTINYEDHAPNYYDEFDANGRLRWDFLNNQLYKLRRIPTLWY